MNAQLCISDDGSVLAELKARPLFLQQIIEAQKVDDEIMAKQTQCNFDFDSHYQQTGFIVFNQLLPRYYSVAPSN